MQPEKLLQGIDREGLPPTQPFHVVDRRFWHPWCPMLCYNHVRAWLTIKCIGFFLPRDPFALRLFLLKEKQAVFVFYFKEKAASSAALIREAPFGRMCPFYSYSNKAKHRGSGVKKLCTEQWYDSRNCQMASLLCSMRSPGGFHKHLFPLSAATTVI